MAGWTRRGLLAAGGAALLAGCDIKGAEPGGAGSGEGKITALFMKQAGYSEDDIKAMTADFAKQHPKIQVEPTFVAFEALHDKIVSAAPAGTYDVVLFDVIWPAEFGTKKIVSEVGGNVPGEWKSQMLKGALTTAEYRGKTYGVPWILDTKYLFHNTELLAKAGVDAGDLATWDGVLGAARKLKAAGVQYPLVWSWKQAEALVCDYTQLLGAFGGTFLSADGTAPAFNTGGGVTALEFMKRSLDEKLSNPNSMESLEDDVRKIFAQGQAALCLNWTFVYNAANDPKDSQIANKVGVTPTPAGPSGNPGVNGSMALSVPPTSKNQKAAWTYVSFLTSQKVQNSYAKSSLPCWGSSYDDAEVAKTSPAVVPVAKKQLGNLINRPQVPKYNEMSLILQAELQSALLGKKAPQKALDDAAAQAKPLLG